MFLFFTCHVLIFLNELNYSYYPPPSGYRWKGDLRMDVVSVCIFACVRPSVRSHISGVHGPILFIFVTVVTKYGRIMHVNQFWHRAKFHKIKAIFNVFLAIFGYILIFLGLISLIFGTMVP